jgi:hypothetical protein
MAWRRIMFLLLLAATAAPGQQELAVVGGTLIDGTGAPPRENVVIFIRDGVITGVGPRSATPLPAGLPVIDASGQFILPGFIDCHVHPGEPTDFADMLAWGVTSANCMFESTDMALAVERQTSSDTAQAPRIYGAAPIFTTEGGWWSGEGFPIDSTIDRFPKTAAEARTQVGKAKAKGMHRIKVMADDMGWCRDPLPRFRRIPAGVLQALVDEAGERLMVEVHAPQLRDAREVTRALTPSGAPGRRLALAHGIIDSLLDRSFVDALRGERYYVSTLCVFEFLADVEQFMRHALADPRIRSGLPPKIIEKYASTNYYEHYRKNYPNIAFVRAHLPTLLRNTKTLVDAGIHVPLGTDMWAFPGIGVHLELEYMVDAGLSPLQAIVAATGEGGQFLGVPELGTIRAGKRADLLLLRDNPLADIRNTRSLTTIIKGGVVFDHRQLVEARTR